MVDVTIEALQTVKSALIDFRTDIEGMSKRTENSSFEILSSCKAAVDKAAMDVEASEAIIEQLSNELEQDERQIDD